MSLVDRLRGALLHPSVRGLDLDSPEATRVHGELIRSKPLLRRLYRSYYAEFLRAGGSSLSGVRLEIGSGGGFLKDLDPRVVTVDIRPGAEVDAVASALELPIAPGSVGAIYALNVLHHLPDLERFFREAVRVLAPGGRAVLIEPYVSPFSRLVYGHLHHEPFDPESRGWTLEPEGPMTAANGALPWIALVRDRDRFDATFPELEVVRITPHTVLSYLVSGGVSMRSLLPGAAFAPLRAAERLLGPALPRLATMMTVELLRLP
jgi:SAM-dependent methyltransferase